MTTVDVPRDLGDGLVLRRATPADNQQLSEFSGRMHQQPYDTVAAAWTRDLLRGDHPTGAHDHVLIVEDSVTKQIVSSSMLISQTWSYGGVSVATGRPELIATDPEYRRRGLVREQFRTLHVWGEAAGQNLQVITGIPNYYRQFGYEPALGVSGLIAPAHRFPAPDSTADGPFRVRPVTPDDLPALKSIAAQVAARSLINVERDDALWRYEIFARDPGSDYVHSVEFLETVDGQVAGALAYVGRREGGEVTVTWCEVAPGFSWRTVGIALLRRLRAIGESQVAASGPLTGIAITGGLNHPLLAAFPGSFVPSRRDFFFYVRIPDYLRFLRLVAPALERKLAESALAGYDGSLRINLYRSGLAITFAAGKIVAVEHWDPTRDSSGLASFPGLTLSQLILGSRSVTELEYAFADCSVASGEARALLDILFTRQVSTPWPVG